MFFVLLSCIVYVMMLIFTFTITVKEEFTNMYDHKTKCFDCERHIIARCGMQAGWMAQPTKSFDSEQELLHRMKDLSAGYGAKTLRYY